MKHFRIAIDFDGTLFEDRFSIDESFSKKLDLTVKPHASEVTEWLKTIGYEILIFTCRPDYHRTYLEGLLKKNNITFDYILFYTKPRVDLYIDDKGFRFNNWLDTKQWISNTLYKLGKLPVYCEQPDTQFEKYLRIEKIKSLPINQIRSILDIGCGSGSMWNDISFKGILHAVEPDDLLRDKAKNSPISKLFNSIELVDISKYDCVSCLGVLEHVDCDKMFLNQLHKAKCLYFTVPNAESFHRNFGKNLGIINSLDELQDHDHSVGHQRYYTFDTFQELINNFATQHNFFVSNFGTCNFKFTSNIEMISYIEKYPALIKTAEQVGLIGRQKKYGAELYAYLEKKTA
jgi:SAM-dependent methyltransferase